MKGTPVTREEFRRIRIRLRDPRPADPDDVERLFETVEAYLDPWVETEDGDFPEVDREVLVLWERQMYTGRYKGLMRGVHVWTLQHTFAAEGITHWCELPSHPQEMHEDTTP